MVSRIPSASGASSLSSNSSGASRCLAHHTGFSAPGVDHEGYVSAALAHQLQGIAPIDAGIFIDLTDLIAKTTVRMVIHRSLHQSILKSLADIPALAGDAKSLDDSMRKAEKKELETFREKVQAIVKRRQA